MNIHLKIALIKARMRQVDVAMQVGMDEPKFSRIVNQRCTPTAEQREKIAQVLGSTIDALWPLSNDPGVIATCGQEFNAASIMDGTR